MHVRKEIWLYLGILGLGIASLYSHMEQSTTTLVVRKPVRREQYLEHPRYQVYKFTKHLTLKDYVLIHKIFLDKKHTSIFTCILDGMKTVQLMMQRGNITYVTGRGYVMERTWLRTEPGLVLFSVPELSLALKFHVTERVELILDGKRYTNVVCICRYYFN